MSIRRSRVEQTAHNRERLLSAARDVFVRKGFHIASLDDIAREAGFSKGVVYSQFASKADLFLSLLERRIEARADRGAELVAGLTGIGEYGRFVEELRRTSEADREWTLLVVEFRVVAARDPVLSARYAAAHARTVERLAGALGALYDRSGTAPPQPLPLLAAAILALANGMALEQAAGVEVTPEEARAVMGRLLGVR